MGLALQPLLHEGQPQLLDVLSRLLSCLALVHIPAQPGYVCSCSAGSEAEGGTFDVRKLWVQTHGIRLFLHALCNLTSFQTHGSVLKLAGLDQRLSCHGWCWPHVHATPRASEDAR